MSERGKAWIVISRPDRLPNAIAAAQALRGLFAGGVHLLREQSKWWQCADWHAYASQFDQVHAFRRVETCRGLRDLPRLYRESADRVRGIAQLPVDPQRDMIFCLGGILTISNATASAHPRVRKALCVSAKVYRELHQAPDRAHYRFTTSGWMQNRIVEPLARLNRTLHFKPRINPGGDGVRLERLQFSPEEIYDSVVVMSNNGDEVPDHPELGLVSARFPRIAELRDLPQPRQIEDEQRQVIFFGTPFLLVQNLSPDTYIAHLNRCLEYLRANFPGRALIYRPHPYETKEAQQIDLAGFRLEDDREAAELYFLRHFTLIDGVFSVSSTVSRTALNNGLNAYAFYPVFPFTEKQIEFFQTVMGDVPREFQIGDLSSPPMPYQPLPQTSGRSFAEALRQVVGRTAAAA